MNALLALDSLQRLQEVEGQDDRQRKQYNVRIDPFLLRDMDFKKRYRFYKATIREIISLVEEELAVDARGAGISQNYKYWLPFVVGDDAQDDSGELHGVSQPTVSRICAKVARALAAKAPLFIKMPASLSEQQAVMEKFRTIRNFPGVIGAIDCTHIKINKTGGDQSQYYINRKGQYSLNVQVVCDAQLKIMDIVARWRGSTHDSRIFNECQLKQRFEARHFRGRLLGDSGYPLLPYLFTPLLRPSSQREERYNEAQIATRNTVERCFGVWKQKFQCIQVGLPVKLYNCKAVIVALAVLHNIAVDMNDTDVVPDDDDSSHGDDDNSSSGDVQIGGEINLDIPTTSRTNATPNFLRRRSQLILQNFISQNF